MDVTRRDFLKISGSATAGLMLGSLFDLAPIRAYATANPPQWDHLTTSICCYCAVGCGLLVATSGTDPDAVYVQGDPDHPVNRGSLCSKGQAIGQLHTVDGSVNPRRLTQPLYRAPGTTTWQTKSWTWMLDEIASRIKTTRDSANPGYTGGTDPNSPVMNTTLTDDISYSTGTVSVINGSPNVVGNGTKWAEWSGKVQNGDKFKIDSSSVEYVVSSVTDDTHLTLTTNFGETSGTGLDYEIKTTIPVNRCTGIACLGGAAHDTEECYLLVKLMRALGIVYLEHQARI